MNVCMRHAVIISLRNVFFIFGCSMNHYYYFMRERERGAVLQLRFRNVLKSVKKLEGSI